jgi:hypothetical protein
MFKKSLLALGVVAVSASAFAVDTKVGPTTPWTISHQGLAVSSTTGAVTETITLNGAQDVLVDLGDAKASGYSSLKEFVLDISGATISPSSSVTLGLPTSSTGAISYPTDTQMKVVVTNTGSAWTSSSAVSISGLVLTPDSNAIGETISATYKAISSVGGSTIDSATTTLTKVVDEFKATVTSKFDADVDVNQLRKDFVGNATDVMTVQIDDASTTFEDIGAQAVSLTLTGDFAWTDGDADGAVDAGLISGDFVVATGLAKAATAAFNTSDGASVTKSITVDGDDKHVIPAASYSLDVLMKNATNTVTYYEASLDAGAWTLNGGSQELPFVPFGSAYAHSITVSNTSTLDGEITVELIANGEKVTEVLDEVATAKSVTQIGKSIAALAALNDMSSAQVNVIVNAPDTEVTISGVYYSKADGDRVRLD